MRLAVVPACGQSSRMGRPKLALPLGNRTVIERVVVALREGGVERVLVVVGPHVPELVSLASAAGSDVLALPESTPDMRVTVERGLAWIAERYDPAPNDCWLLAPADHPAFSPAVVSQLLNAATDSSCSVIVPVHKGRRGLPPFSAGDTRSASPLPTGEDHKYLRGLLAKRWNSALRPRLATSTPRITCSAKFANVTATRWHFRCISRDTFASTVARHVDHSATTSTSIVGSAAMRRRRGTPSSSAPSCGVALPMPTCPQARRTTSAGAADFVRPVMACFVAVYGGIQRGCRDGRC